MDRKDFVSAINMLKKFLRIERNREQSEEAIAEILFNLGICYLNQEDSKGAEGALEESLKMYKELKNSDKSEKIQKLLNEVKMI